MIRLLLAFVSWCAAFFRSRHDLGLELIALRQQVSVLKCKNPRPKLTLWDRLFWLGLRRWWSQWASVLVVVVKPETVVRWHRAGFGWYWRFLSRHSVGRPRITPELRHLIRSMAAENPTWGAPRIHGELLKLGFEISEATVSRYLALTTPSRDSGKRWLTFLKNHREAIAAMDFFTVPTATFRVLYCFFVIGHGRRKIVHFNVTENPTPRLDRAATAGGFPGGSCTQVPDPRPGQQLQRRSRHPVGRLRHRADSHGLSQPVAEWCGGALGGKLSSRTAGPCDRAE